MTIRFYLCAIILFASGASYAQTRVAYDGYVKKANDFFGARQYAQSAEAFSQAFAAIGGKGYPEDRYNAACAWAHTGNKDSAFFELNKIATKVNYSDYSHIIADSNLINLHSDKRWKPLCALVKRNKEKLEAHYNRPLIALLDSVYKNDQNDRVQLDDIQKKYGADSKEVAEKWEIIGQKDSSNLIIVEKILKKYGWLGPEVIGEEGNETLFLVIQHANLKAQEKYFNELKMAVKNHKAQPADLALLQDRVALRQGKKQIYGSQIGADTEGHFWVLPIEDPDNVDKRRAEVGLGPMKDYVKTWNIVWDLEEYKKQLSEMERDEKK